MRRALLAALIVFAASAQYVSADEGWVITRFAADITIRKDASLHIVEAIDVDFGTLERHGIFRNIPVRYQYDDTHLRAYRLEVRSVTDAAGRRLTFETSDQGADRVIKIGDADKNVTGVQTYRITYDVSGAMNALSDHDELFWNVNGAAWPVATRTVSAVVHSDGGVTRATCFQGRSGSRDPCRATSSASEASFATTRAMSSGEQLTIVTALAKGTVTEPRPILERDTSDPLTYFELQPTWLGLAAF